MSYGNKNKPHCLIWQLPGTSSQIHTQLEWKGQTEACWPSKSPASWKLETRADYNSNYIISKGKHVLDITIWRTSVLVKALSVIEMRSSTAGAEISSYLPAISITVTPTSCNFFLVICWTAKNLSIRLTDKYRVSGLRLNLSCTCSFHQSVNNICCILINLEIKFNLILTSINQSIRIRRILSLISNWLLM